MQKKQMEIGKYRRLHFMSQSQGYLPSHISLQIIKSKFYIILYFVIVPFNNIKSHVNKK